MAEMQDLQDQMTDQQDYYQCLLVVQQLLIA